jgi:hypothetical protein
VSPWWWVRWSLSRSSRVRRRSRCRLGGGFAGPWSGSSRVRCRSRCRRLGGGFMVLGVGAAVFAVGAGVVALVVGS